MSGRNRESKPVDAEKMALLAQKGPHAVRLSKREYDYLFHEGGLDEIDAIRRVLDQPREPLDEQLARRIVHELPDAPQRHPTLSIRLLEQVKASIESLSPGLVPGSPAFAFRGEQQRDADTVCVHRRVGNRTVHLRIRCTEPDSIDIDIKVRDSHDRHAGMLEVSLYRNGSCVDSISSSHDDHLTLRRIRPGDYTLHVSDAEAEITIFNLRLE